MAGSFAGGPYTGGGNFRFSWYGARVAGQIDAAVQKAMDETAQAAKTEAQGRARVDTGAMRDSIDATLAAHAPVGAPASIRASHDHLARLLTAA